MNETDVVTNGEVRVNSAMPTDGVEMKSDAEDGEVKNRDDQLPQLGNDDREMQCGIPCWRPSCLRPLGNMWCFTAALCVMNICSSMNFAYVSAVITQIERRFGLTSQTTGFVKNIDNIGFMLTVLAVSHLGRYGNKPRILGLSSCLSGFSIFVFATPHFIYGGPGASRQASWSSWNVSSTVERRRGSQYEVCDGVDESLADPTGCSSRNTLLEFNGGAMALFIISEMLQGMANAPKATMSLTYMDDNARERFPLYVGILFGMRSFAPMLGFALGAWTNSLYVDLNEPGIDKRDPRWIGAWWLGFVICAACITIWSFPVMMFPPKLAGADNVTAANKEKNLLSNVRDLPRACWRLLSNPVYLSLVISLCFTFTLTGYGTFLPKYLEFYFGLSASWASIYAGAVMASSWTLGPLIGGPVMTRMKLNIPRTLAVIVIAHAVVAVGYLMAMLLGCSEAPWAGTVADQQGSVLPQICNGNCSCDPTAFTPVCGSDGLNYFSPCYAGCQLESRTDNRTEFFDCACIEDGRATGGLCPRQCTFFYVFIVIIFLAFLLNSMMSVPFITVALRCVDDEDKAMAVALGTFLGQLAAFPAPMMYGAVIDSTCRVFQQSCTRKGACLLYNNDSLRFRWHLLPFCAQLATVAFEAAAWYLSRRREQAAANIRTTNVELDDEDGRQGHRDDVAADGKNAVVLGPYDEDGKIVGEKQTSI